MRADRLVALLTLAFASLALAQEKTRLAYQVNPGTQLVTETEGTSEGMMWGGGSGRERSTFTSKEKRKMVGQLTEQPSGDTGDWKVTGEYSAEMNFNGNARDPQTESIGPVVFTFNERGEVVRTKCEPFEATPQNLMRMRWWRYVVQQLDLPPVMPEDEVAPGDKWSSELNLSGPDGKPLRGKAEFRFVGTSSEDSVQTAWIRGELNIPLEFRFKSDEGQLDVDGKIRIDRLFAFDIEKGLPAGSTDHAIMDVSIRAKRNQGEEFNLQLCMHAEGKTTTKEKAAEDDKPKE